MLRAVLDTNVLVSGLLSSRGPPAALLDAIVEVLMRPALRLNQQAVLELLLLFGDVGEYGTPPVSAPSELSLTDFPDADDIPFYTAALAGRCLLVTGNLKHCPKIGQVDVVSPAQAVKIL